MYLVRSKVDQKFPDISGENVVWKIDQTGLIPDSLYNEAFNNKQAWEIQYGPSISFPILEIGSSGTSLVVGDSVWPSNGIFPKGLKADGVADDSSAIQALIDSASETSRLIIKFPPNRRIKINTGLVMRAGAVSIDLNGCVIDASGIGSGSAITINPPLDTGPNYDEGNLSMLRPVLANGRIEGKKAAASRMADESYDVTGMTVDAVTHGTGALHGMVFSNVTWRWFRKGVFLDDEVYISSFFNCNILACWEYGFSQLGITDAGENISFFGGRIADCRNTGGTGVGIYMPSGNNGEIHLHGVSLDYNDIQGDLYSGHLKMFGGHVEGNGANPFFRINSTNSGQFVELHLATHFAPTEAAPGRTHLIETTGDRCFIDTSGLFVYGYNYRFEVIRVLSGSPQINYKGIKILGTGATPVDRPYISDYLNQALQSQDYSTPGIGAWRIGGSVTTAVAAGAGNGGGNAIRATFTAGGDAYLRFSVTPGQRIMWEYDLNVTALAASQSIRTRTTWQNENGSGSGLNSNIDNATISAVTGYTKYGANLVVPPGVFYVLVAVNNSGGAATVDIDNFKVWTF